VAAEASGGGRAVSPPERDPGSARALGLSTGWAVFSYLIAGMVAYGGIGWLVGRAVHAAVLFPVGMLAGLAISLSFVVYRYGRAAAQATEGASRDR
jgi:ATP synthase protein I